jgi:hypothetical protein
MIYVIENDAPLMRLMVWGLREAGVEAMSVPMPEADRFADHGARAVIINCDETPERCRAIVQAIHVTLPGVPVLDLATHDRSLCGADAQVSPPYRLADVIDWVSAQPEEVA